MPQRRTVPHPGDEELAAYAMDEGAVAPPIAAHVAGCGRCGAEVASLRELARAFDRTLYRINCPPAGELTDFALGDLPAAGRRAVAAHLKRCARCAEEVAVAREVFAEEAPSRSLWDLARRVVAALVPAPPAGGAALALRGEDDDADRPQTYRVPEDGIEVTLRHEAEQGGYVLYGTVSLEDGRVGPALSARLVRSGEPDAAEVAQTAVEPYGFALGPVPAGIYRLEMLLPDRVIEIVEVAL